MGGIEWGGRGCREGVGGATSGRVVSVGGGGGGMVLLGGRGWGWERRDIRCIISIIITSSSQKSICNYLSGELLAKPANQGPGATHVISSMCPSYSHLCRQEPTPH